MKKVVLLSMDNLSGFSHYDHLLINPLINYGWEAEIVSWKNENINWKDFDAVIVRSTWDYQDFATQFLQKLELINSVTHLENKLEILKWNMEKTYLRDLENKGIRIVQSIWRDKFSKNEVSSFFTDLDCSEIIIKPTISASAFNTFRLSKDSINSQIENLQSTFGSRAFVVQPFMDNIISEGEFSLFYFGGEYSHTIQKTPKQNDFRVQEEHGGILKLVQPEPMMIQTADQILETLETKLLYARIDFVRTKSNDFALMELELIEPSLYFNMNPEAPEKFARVFNDWMSNISQS